MQQSASTSNHETNCNVTQAIYFESWHVIKSSFFWIKS